MRKKVLFIDDDALFARLYKEKLENEFDLTVCYDAMTAIKHLKSTIFDAAVVDAMMPPPIGMKDECHDGNTTGLWVLGQCSQEIKVNRTAILIFTHQAIKFIQDEMKFLELDPKITKVTSKTITQAENVPIEVASLISRR